MAALTKAVFGWSVHSGWAALVCLAERNGALDVLDHRRIDLIDEPWAKHPYHAAEDLTAAAAGKLIENAKASTARIAEREVRAAVAREAERGTKIVASAVLVGTKMPSWTVDEIRAVHMRMHMAEGALFRDALMTASTACGLRAEPVAEKTLPVIAAAALGRADADIAKTLAVLGKKIGPPWSKDQKDATLAAWVALSGKARRE